jgi:hypothetical protein
VIAGLVPASPGWVIGAAVSIWANHVLHQPQVRRAFIERARQRLRARQDPADASPPRFSRAAMVGAVWAPFCFVAAVCSIVPVQTATTRPSTMGSVAPVIQQAVSSEEIAPDDWTGPEDPSTPAIRPGRQPLSAAGLAWWQWVLVLTVLPLGVTAPFGTTVLGLVAISSIRHSQGRLTGLPLALADALLFPLLALDSLVFLFFVIASALLVPLVTRTLGYAGIDVWLAVAIAAVSAVPICAVLDVLLVRAAWQKATAGIRTGPNG